MNMDVGTVAEISIAIVSLLFIIAWAVITIIGQWKLFEKCGEKGWKSIIPFYNDWTIVEISACHWWYFLFIVGEAIFALIIDEVKILAGLSVVSGLLSVVSIYVILCINYNIAKKFHQGVGFAVGMTLVPFVFYLILGFSEKYKYDKKIKVNPWGLYDFENKKSDLKVERKYCSNCGTEITSNFCPKCGTNKKGV